MTGVIHHELVLPASRDRIYAALTKAAEFSAFTGGASTVIDPSPGGAFSLFGGRIVGRNLELERDERVVQAWRAGDWAPGEYSIVRIELRKEGTGTRIVFDQSGHPASAQDHLGPGWSKMYWEPLAAYLQ